VAARLYLGGVIAVGLSMAAVAAFRAQVERPALFLALVALSSIASTIKIRLPLMRSASTMSVSYVVDFTSLLLLGAHQTVFVAAASVLTQSTLNVRRENPVYRTLFNIAAIALTVEFSGWVYHLFGGVTGDVSWPDQAWPVLATATAYFVGNTATVAGAVAVTSGQTFGRVWNDNFFWCAPSYFVGAGVATLAAIALEGVNTWLLPIIIPPVYLTFRSYKVYLGRLEDQQRHAQQLAALNTRTQEALASVQESEGRLRDALEQLKSSEERYALAAAGANDGLWDWDIARNQVYFSERWKSMLGLTDDAVSGSLLDWMTRVHGQDIDGLRNALSAHLSGNTPLLSHEYRMRMGDGSYRWMLCRGMAVRSGEGEPTRIAGSQTDITGRREAQANLEHAAHHDALTGLPNRPAFMRDLGRILARSRRAGDFRYAVLFVDVDRFKLVNDSLGHLVGDQLLQSVAHKLGSCLRAGDILARLGGDEFTILLDGINDTADVEFIADRIQALFREPVVLDDGREIFVTASIGVTMGSPQYEHPEELLRDSDTAMYRAKALGKACHVVFEQRMRDHAVVQLNLETELRRAVEHNELHLVFQPVVALISGALSGFEVLLRWQRTGGEFIPPSEFIPLAEETGIIVPLGSWVINEACRQAAEWQRQFPSEHPLTVSVNISPRQLMQSAIVETVAQALRRHSVEHGTLALEITESALAEDAATAMRVIKDLKTLGVQVLLDDFGTGYSSLGHLHRFPVDTVKIDRSFLTKDPADVAGSNLLSAVIALAQNLEKGVIVEGIETPEQVERLRRLECPHGQGYYFSRPVPVAEATALIELMDTHGRRSPSPVPVAHPVVRDALRVH
jgi:diguanylate cyclase (GGDEF)-like protein/PAS domain S-box-containing protein